MATTYRLIYKGDKMANIANIMTGSISGGTFDRWAERRVPHISGSIDPDTSTYEIHIDDLYTITSYDGFEFYERDELVLSGGYWGDYNPYVLIYSDSLLYFYISGNWATTPKKNVGICCVVEYFNGMRLHNHMYNYNGYYTPSIFLSVTGMQLKDANNGDALEYSITPMLAYKGYFNYIQYTDQHVFVDGMKTDDIDPNFISCTDQHVVESMSQAVISLNSQNYYIVGKNTIVPVYPEE